MLFLCGGTYNLWQGWFLVQVFKAKAILKMAFRQHALNNLNFLLIYCILIDVKLLHKGYGKI